MKIKSITFLFLFTLNAHSLDLKIKTDGEDQKVCSQIFKETVIKLEQNYIDYKKIENTPKHLQYQKVKSDFDQITAHTEVQNCSRQINQFLNFFNDGHLSVIERPQYSTAEVSQLKEAIKQQLKGPKELIEEVKSFKPQSTADQIVGIYIDTYSKIAVTKHYDSIYHAYVLSSSKDSVDAGELKASFSFDGSEFYGKYLSYDYQPRFTRGVLFKENTILTLDGGILWAKVNSEHEKEVAMINQQDPQLPTITKIDNKNVLFSIPSFLTPQKEFIQILSSNLDTLADAENLIIDVRGNRGGNALYFSFIELYATTSLFKGTKRGEVFASADTMHYYQNMAKSEDDIYGVMAKEVKANIGNIIPGPAYQDRILTPYPSKIKSVAILTDGATASAAESFIIHSKRISDKVKTFGSATYGMIDNTSVNSIRLTSSGNQNIYFAYPTSTLGEIDGPKYPKGYNEKGILPDVYIDDLVEDKVNFITDYLKN